jgi:hypothetical protein
MSARQINLDHFLHLAYVFTYADGWRRATQVKERITNELAGSMIGELTASGSRDEVGTKLRQTSTLRLKFVFGLPTSCRVNRPMLQ